MAQWPPSGKGPSESRKTWEEARRPENGCRPAVHEQLQVLASKTPLFFADGSYTIEKGVA